MLRSQFNIRRSTLALFILIFLFDGQLFAQEDITKQSKQSEWVYAGNLDADYFRRRRLILFSSTAGWLGGRRKAGDPANHSARSPLYRLKGDSWHFEDSFPVITDRTYEFSAYDENNLVVIVHTDEAYYDSLHIWQYQNSTWSEEIVKPGLFPQASFMVSPDEIWIVGNHGRMLHKKNGIWTYRPLSLDTTAMKEANLMDIKMLNPDFGWTVGRRGTMARYDGRKWSLISLPEELASTPFLSVDITDDGAVWLATDNGLILRYFQESWTQFTDNNSGTLCSISMQSPTSGWAVGSYGRILKYDGQEWYRVHSPMSDQLTTVKVIDDSTGWIAGSTTLFKLKNIRSHPFSIEMSDEKTEIDKLKGITAIMKDLDSDLDMDMAFFSQSKMYVYSNNGSGDLSPSSIEFDPAVDTEISKIISVTSGDIDHDAIPDFIASRNMNEGSIVIQNTGDRIFLRPENIKGGKWDDDGHFLDYDLDGDLDYYFQRAISINTEPIANQLYQNDGFGNFSLADTSTGDAGCERITLWGDLNGDLYPDLIIPDTQTTLRTYVNNRDGTFRENTAESGLLNSMKGHIAQALLEDIDIDGDLDLIAIGSQVYTWKNDGNFHFTRVHNFFPNELGNNMVSAPRTFVSGDVNNDGFPDFIFYLLRGNDLITRFYLSDQSGSYVDISEATGLSMFNGVGVIMEDWDNDGDLDLYVFQKLTNENQYFSNELNSKNYLKITPRGTVANRMGIGSEIKIYESGHLHNPDYLRGYKQHGVSKNPKMVSQQSTSHFGLDATKKYDIQISFPGGRTIVRENVQTSQNLIIYEYPSGIRHVYLSWRALLLSGIRANLLLELSKLILLAAFLFALITTFRKKQFSFRFISKWYVWLAFGIIYLAINSLFVLDRNPVTHLGLVAGPFILLALTAYTDSYYSFWRDSNYIGHYRLLERIGEGGMGIVHKAYDVNKRLTCALKVLHPTMLEHEKNRMRFLREAKIMESLHHDNIVNIYETGEIGGRGYINMELLEGITLRDLVTQSGPLSSGIIIPIIMQICDALEYMHQKQIIHRDIKSDNIFLVTKQTRNLQSRITNSLRGSSSEKSLIKTKLMDFGLARSMQMMSLTKMEAIVGTLAYMSPEQAIGKDIDQRSDIYSLGVVMYEGLTGEFPFSGEHEVAVLQSIIANKQLRPIHELRPDIMPELENLVLKMLQYNPAERFQSAQELNQALEKIPITLETTFVSRRPTNDASALKLSQKSITMLSAGDKRAAIELSEEAIKKLENSDYKDLNSGQVYLNHFKVLNAAGSVDKARTFLERAHQSVIMKKISHTGNQSVTLPPNPLDRQIVITYETDKWQMLYSEAKKLESANKISDARIALLECAGILTQVFMLFDNEADKETYIVEYKVETVLKFMKKFDL